ncbi:hypothetical protein [Morganella morganii]|uniref:hypothetical protein n=1 Tax=Morganella morganii TaxID=582 RepID=UPI0032DBA139
MNSLVIRYGFIAVTALLIGYRVGDILTTGAMQKQVDKEIVLRQTVEKEFSDMKQSLSDQYAESLKKIVYQQQEQAKQNAELSEKFSNTLSNLSKTTRRIESSIPAAVAADGDGWNGIGDSGLRLYREALGYGESGSDSVILSAPAAGTAVPAAPSVTTGIRHTTGTAETRGTVRGVGSDTGRKAAGIAGMGGTAKAEQ